MAPTSAHTMTSPVDATSTARRRWRTIIVATLVLVPSYSALLMGMVELASEDPTISTERAAAAIAFGLAVVPFVFIVVAFMSGHPSAPSAVLRAMGLSLLVGVVVSAIAADAVTGVVTGVGAGGMAALRRDPPCDWRHRAVAVLVAALYTFVLVRTVSALVLVSAPVFPLTAIGLADHWSEWRAETTRS